MAENRPDVAENRPDVAANQPNAAENWPEGTDVAECEPHAASDSGVFYDPLASAQLPATADVVVVGAGAIGLAIAYALAGRGRAPVVVDRGPLGTGTSWGNAGFVVPSHVIPVSEPGMFGTALRSILSGKGPVTMRPLPSANLLRWVVRFLRHCRPQAVHAAAPVLAALSNLSTELFRKWLAEERIECAYTPDGLLNVFGDPRAFAKARHHAQWEATFGMPSQILDADETRTLEPALNPSVVGAVLHPQDAGLDPGRFLAGLAAAAVRRGATLVSEAEVLDARTDAGELRSLITARGEIQAREVVIAAGAWSPRLAARFGHRLPIQPAKGYSITAHRPAHGPRRRMLLGEKYVAVAPMGDKLRLSGWFELGRRDARLPAARLARVEENARSRLHLDAGLRVISHWAGFRPVTPDGLPIIGRAPGWRNLTYATGHAMLGLSLAPATGALVAQLLCGEPSQIDIGRCAPERFR